MHLYPQNTLEKLEFDLIRNQISRNCTGRLSREEALAIVPSSDVVEITRGLNECAAFKVIRENGLAFPDFRYIEVEKELGLLKIQGAILDGNQFMLLRSLCEVATELVVGVRKQIEFPSLQQIVVGVEPDTEMRKLIDAVLTERGEVRSSASKALGDIRKRIDEIRRQSAKLFDGHLRKYRKLGWLREYTESVYHDRRVLAVVAEYKNKIEGIIHGTSDTGNTAFVEPSNLVGLNNELGAALRDETREEHRILKLLTRELGVYYPILKSYYLLLARFDLLDAKVKFARSIRATKPLLNESCSRLFVRDARHPVLFLKNQSEGLPTIPLEMELTSEKSMLVISGPNAGGKSIALKTVGLLQIMLQSGLLIPVHEASEFPIYAQLLVDIGDDQSIEQQLSTYSSRLKKQKNFLRVADARTLILLDEFGTGSDPELGGAIAESILIHLMEYKPWGIITTHFSNIKIAADRLEGLRNGCMLFNEETLEPLYELKLDSPGSSYTFEVARKIGMDKKVLDLARTKVDKRKVKLDQLLVDLQLRQKAIENELHAVGIERQILKGSMQRLEEAKEEVKAFRASQQKEEHKRLVELGKKYEELIDFWNERQNKKELFAKIMQAGAKRIQKIKKAEARGVGSKGGKKAKPRRKKKVETIEIGDRVRLVGGKTAGTVVDLDGKRAVVEIGNMKMTVKTDQLLLAIKKSSK